MADTADDTHATTDDADSILAPTDDAHATHTTADDADECFSSATRAAFDDYLNDHPSTRRVPSEEEETMIGWLTTNAVPITVKESNRRSYIRKNFKWKTRNQRLYRLPKTPGDKKRKVVLLENIPRVVQRVHRKNGHRGWDVTWQDVQKRYYGILRADVVFLLKRCETCVKRPSHQPKGSHCCLNGCNHPQEHEDVKEESEGEEKMTVDAVDSG